MQPVCCCFFVVGKKHALLGDAFVNTCQISVPTQTSIPDLLGMVSFPSLMFFEGIEWFQRLFIRISSPWKIGGRACPHFDHFVNWIYVGLCNPIYVFKRLKPQRSPWENSWAVKKKTAEKVTWTLEKKLGPKTKIVSQTSFFSGAVTISFRKHTSLPTQYPFSNSAFLGVFRWTICTEDALYIEISNLRMSWCQMICHLDSIGSCSKNLIQWKQKLSEK